MLHLTLRPSNPHGLTGLDAHTRLSPIFGFKYQNNFFGVNAVDSAQANRLALAYFHDDSGPL